MHKIKTVHGTIDWNFDEEVNRLIEQGWWVLPETFRIKGNTCYIIMAKDVEDDLVTLKDLEGI
jgi:hypothetical protein